MKTGLVIPVYNRMDYVRECFESVAGADMRNVHIVIVNDGGSTPLPALDLPHTELTFAKNKGVKVALLTGIERCIKDGCDTIINLDSDAIVMPDFIAKLLGVHRQSGLIASGFNNPNEHTQKQLDGHAIKAHANGINMCFSAEQYETRIKPALLAPSGNWDYMASESAGKVVIVTPSVVQHIGLISSMGHDGADIAHDFKRLRLPDVTLFGIDSKDIHGISRAATISQRDIEYGAVNVIADDLFTKHGNRDIRIRDYSKFMINELHNQFSTSHALTIHADGYVINYKAWRDEWLQYDYIGAPWWYNDGYDVGNGGFSLRSHKLCKLLADAQIEHTHPEDHCICRIYRESLEAHGIKFAPLEVARQFSIEAYKQKDNKYSGQFGFHGPHVDFSQSKHKSLSYIRNA